MLLKKWPINVPTLAPQPPLVHCLNVLLTENNILYFTKIVGFLLAKYMLSLGTSAGSGDIVPSTRVSYDVTRYCMDGLHLQHKAVYFASVTAFNGGLNERAVTVNSDGGR